MPAPPARAGLVIGRGGRFVRGGRPGQRAVAERPGAPLEPRRGPAVLGHPASGVLGDEGRRRDVVLHPDAQHGLVHDAGVDALEPVVPEAQRFLQVADRRSRHDLVGKAVRPGSDQALARPGQAGQQAHDGGVVTVGPAADRVDRRFDRRVVLADRAVLPVGVATLVGKPGFGPVAVGGQALEPTLAPALGAHDLRVRRQRIEVQHGGSPGQHVEARDAAALVVHVVGVTVVGRHEGDDRLQRRRSQRRHLQAVEARPGDAGHANVAAAPGLRREPGDHLADVAVLLHGVLVVDQAVRVAGAAQVDTDAGVAVAGPVGVDVPIALAAVGQAVRAGFEDGRHGVAGRVVGQPDAAVQPVAVGEGDPLVVEHLQAAGEPVADLHGRNGSRIVTVAPRALGRAARPDSTGRLAAPTRAPPRGKRGRTPMRALPHDEDDQHRDEDDDQNSGQRVHAQQPLLSPIHLPGAEGG